MGNGDFNFQSGISVFGKGLLISGLGNGALNMDLPGPRKLKSRASRVRSDENLSYFLSFLDIKTITKTFRLWDIIFFCSSSYTYFFIKLMRCVPCV